MQNSKCKMQKRERQFPAFAWWVCGCAVFFLIGQVSSKSYLPQKKGDRLSLKADHPITKECYPASKDDHPMNKDGRPIKKCTHPIAKDGNPIKKDGRLIKK
jgi:hypothetical protein